MRIWLVPLIELSDQHILGQHREWHMLHAMLNNSRFATHPLVLFYKGKKPWLRDFHHKLLREMNVRYQHNIEAHLTPVPEGYETGCSFWPIDAMWIQYDRVDLAQRYMQRPNFFKWTNRVKPKWVRESNIKLGPIPAYQFAKPEVYGQLRSTLT